MLGFFNFNIPLFQDSSEACLCLFTPGEQTGEGEQCFIPDTGSSVGNTGLQCGPKSTQFCAKSGFQCVCYSEDIEYGRSIGCIKLVNATLPGQCEILHQINQLIAVKEDGKVILQFITFLNHLMSLIATLS
jgi:hypothetical protein